MKSLSISIVFVMFMSFLSVAQSNMESTILEKSNFDLINDTLISPSGLKIYPGQKFRLGNRTGTNGRYRSIVSKYAALVPNIWGHNNGYEYLIENYVDNNKGRNQLKELVPGQVVTLGKIKKSGKKEFQFYISRISSESSDYHCDILLALRLKELWFQ